jgi:glycosyltransferase involved in cell wall biosynthesis
MGAAVPAVSVGVADSAPATERVRLLKFVTIFAIGGTERQVMTLASRLDASRYELHLACLRRTGELLDRLPIFRSAPPVEYRITKLFNRHAFRQRLRFAHYLRRQRIQIVHTYSFYPNVFAIAAARLARTPIVVASIRDMGIYQSPRQLRVQRLVCRLAHRVVVNAEAVKSWLVADGYDGDKITVIRNGVETSRFNSAGDDLGLRRDLGLPANCPIAAVVSRLTPSKGLEDFLEAAAVVARGRPDAHFLIVGKAAPADGAYQLALAARAARLGLERRLVFTGLRHDVPEILSQVSVSVLPSLSEGLSNVLLESMAAGVPVVATRVGGNAEAVEDGGTGLLVAPGDPEALARSIDRLLGDAELAKSYGRAGRRRVAEHFTLDRVIHQTEHLYASLLEDRGHGA